MTDQSTSSGSIARLKKENNIKTIPNPPPGPANFWQPSSRLSPAVLDIIISYAAGLGDNKTKTRTLLACALTCRAMLRLAQTYLYHTVVLKPGDPEHYAAFARAIDSNPALGPLVKVITMTVTTPPCIYPLPAHVVGRLSNLQTADFGAFIRHQLYDTSLIRLFAAPGQSLRGLLLAYFGFPVLSVLVRLIWSFPTLESLMLQHCAWVSSPTDVLPDPALHPRHVSKLTHLQARRTHTLRVSFVDAVFRQLWLDFAASTPLPLTPFGTNFTML